MDLMKNNGEKKLYEAATPDVLQEKAATNTKSYDAKWLDNNDNEVEQVFGFNQNAELVNSRAAMIGFLMLILTELLFRGKPVTLTIFGIN